MAAGQVETEAVHMHFSHPVFQATDNETADQRMIGVNRIAAAGIVQEDALIVLVVMIENLSAYALEVDNRPLSAGFGRMIEHHVHNDADARLMHGFHQVPEFAQMGALFGSDAITRMRAEKAVRAVTPIILQSQVEGVAWHILLIESHNRQ